MEYNKFTIGNIIILFFSKLVSYANYVENIHLQPSVQPIIPKKIYVQTNHSFETFCTSISNMKACTIVTPYNKVYSVFQTHVTDCFENNRICISLSDPYKCSIKFHVVIDRDNGVWQCIFPQKEGKGYSNVIDSFNISTFTSSKTKLFVLPSLTGVSGISLLIVAIFIFIKRIDMIRSYMNSFQVS